MALKLTPQDIEKFINTLRNYKPYSREELDQIPLDATPENCPLYRIDRQMSTEAKRILDRYFQLHPEEDVYGYLDGSCFNSK